MLSDPKSILTARGMRCTQQRLDVYRALVSTKCHPNAEQVHRMVQQRRPGTSLATIYNTLDALCGAGLVRRIPTPGGVARYDADLNEHLHAVTSDGQVTDVPGDLSEEILRSLPTCLCDRLERRLGTPVRHLSIQFGEGRDRPPAEPPASC